jgi:hypothetical protein
MIALHCPTIVKRYELAEQTGLKTGQKDRVFRYRDGLRSGNPIDIDEEMVLSKRFTVRGISTRPPTRSVSRAKRRNNNLTFGPSRHT